MAIGNPVSTTSSSVASKTSSVIATAGQTLFTVPAGYVTNHISVFRNGIRLVDGRDYEARNGATVTLLAAATVGDVIEFHVFDTFSVADAVTNQGGTIFGNLTVEGSIGDITANNVTGVAATFTGAVSVGGVLTYEDVTNVDSIGIMTARSGLNVTGGSLGVGLNNPTSYGNFADDFVIYNASQPGMTLASGSTSGYGSIYFADGTSGNTVSRGQIQYSHSNDFMQFSTAATERLRIDSSGRMGLGTNSPSAPLHITNVSPKIILTDSDNSSDISVSSIGGAGVYETASDSIFKTNSAERMRIDSSGRMGLGTNSPEEILHIAAASEAVNSRDGVMFQSTSSLAADTGLPLVFTSHIGNFANYGVASIAGRKENATSGNAAGYLQFATGSSAGAISERMRIDSSGRLLVGTTTPGDAAADNLTIHSSGDTGITIRASESDSSSIYFADGAGGTNVYTGAIIYDHATNHMSLHTNSGAERMRIDSSGNMGLGTVSPGVPLDIAVNNSTANLRITDNTNGARIRLVAASTQFDLYNTGGAGYIGTPTNSDIIIATNNVERIRIESDGRLGIGANNNSSYDSNADDLLLASSGNTGMTIRSAGATPFAMIHFADGTSNNSEKRAGRIVYQHDGDNMMFNTADAERLRIDGSGQLGLGTGQSIDELLHVESSNATVRLKVQSTATNSYPGVRFTNDARTYDLQIDGATDAFRVYDASASSERLRIDSSGNMSLGSSTINLTAAARTTLSLNGTNSSLLAFNYSDTISGFFYAEATEFRMEANGTRPLVFRGNSATLMKINSSGTVDIGNSSSPASANIHLDLYCNSSYDGFIRFRDQSGAPGLIGFDHGSNAMQFYTNGSSEAMRIDSSGQVLIGETSSGGTCKLGMSFGNATGNYMELGGTQRSANGLNKIFVFRHGYWGGSQEVASMGVLTNSSSGGAGNGYAALTFQTGTSGNGDGGSTSTERMRITNGGEVMMGTTSRLDSNAVRLTVRGPFPTTPIEVQQDTSNTHYMMTFRNSNGLVGHITANGSSCSFTNASDYRLKENVVGITDGITRVKQLQPKRFNFIADADTTVDGFLAHEAQSVVPESVIGTKDQVEVWRETDELPEGVSVGDNKLDDEGNTIPVMQGIDTSKLVPLLTAALQEAIAEIENLKARVTALEG